jgi:hypothetical protein
MPVSGESGRGRARRRLARLVASFLGVPQPGHYRRQQELQDELLPRFIENARLSWLLSEPHQADLGCVYSALNRGSQSAPNQIRRLKELLEEMRVLDLLEAVADSPDLPVLANLRSAYEVRLLSYAGHPRASDEFPDLMRKVVANPTILAEARQTLDQAEMATLDTLANVTQFMRPPPQRPTPQRPISRAVERKAEALEVDLSQVVGTGRSGSITVADVENAALPPADQLPKKRKLFGGLGSLFSGLVLGGNGAAPAVVAPVAGPLISLIYLPLVGSFAGGIAAVGKGIGDLKGEG